MEQSAKYSRTDQWLGNAFLQKNNVKFYGTEYQTYDIINDYLEDNQSDHAFFIVDLGEITKAYNRWTTLLPTVKPHYAVKCNPNPVILEALAILGCNFDCASENEIKTIIEITADPSRIIFANPCKMSSQIRYARANDVDLMTFDCEEELYKIKLYHPYAKLILRLAVDDSKSLCKFNKKFGCQMEQVENVLRIAKTLKLDIVGFSFHVGSGCSSAENFYNAIRDCRSATDIALDIGFRIDTIDIGGGFPGVDKAIKFEDIAAQVKNGMEDFFGDMPDVQFIAEPGRYFAQKSHILVLNVIGKKIIYEKCERETKEPDDMVHPSKTDDMVHPSKTDDMVHPSKTDDMVHPSKTDDMVHPSKTDDKRIVYYLNDGVYGSFNCIYFDHNVPTILPFNERDGGQYKSTIFGPTCDSIDLICENAMLPDLAIGEWVYVEDFGAYTAAASSAFNGFKTNLFKYIFTS
jgi:ornithine decarboxylase